MAISPCNTTIDRYQMELIEHGSIPFPIACYADDLSIDDVPWHWHDELEYAIVAEGTPCFLLEQTRVVLHPGEAVFVNSKALHGVENSADHPAVLHSAVFHPRLVGGSMDSIFWQKLIQPMLTSTSLHYVILTPDVPWQAQILACFQSAWKAVADEPEDYENLTRYQLSKAIRILIDHSEVITQRQSEQEQLNDQRIRAMLKYIEAHYMEDITIEDIADSISISVSVCLRCFHHTLGTTPIQYVRQLRLGKATDLLRNTNMTVKDIALECGFNDTSYFTKSFRQKNGCTPKAYRAKQQST